MIKSELGKDEKRTIFLPDARIGLIPPFVRINSIAMIRFVRSITNLLQLLQQFRGAFTESPYYSLLACVNNMNYPRDCFRTSSRLISCLANQILPIFDGCNPSASLFSISCQEPYEAMPLVDSILKLPQAQSSSGVHFFIIEQFNRHSDIQHCMRIDGISNWLHQQIDGPSLKHYRILRIVTKDKSFLIRLDSVQQLIDTIKAVSLSIHFGKVFVLGVELVKDQFRIPKPKRKLNRFSFRQVRLFDYCILNTR